MDRIVSPEKAISLLKEGNARFIDGEHERFVHHRRRRVQTSEQGQRPPVAVLSCSDSRVPVEILFDSGIGEIFTVRVAGNIAGESEIGSLEYAVENLRISVLVVMGHTQCGAVNAAASGRIVHGNVAHVVAKIAPAVAKTRTDFPTLSGDKFAERVVWANVWRSIEDLFGNSSVIRESVRSGRLEVLGACYDIRHGSVEWMGRHPAQERLLGSETHTDVR